ncbi:hypothetical protein PMY38_16810 [Clostridium tertium]|uniref:hypothetical protein n=1 Tax=Clostridium tertium TaxID=1559 RepID=UPI00232E081C|nr:hypothetical protein [Clostridium tertium]MDB1956569.1 hypothetical protein [Clostridium tertium]MDB1960262.1 hypothetical protein [Clostridium tertium]MDB1964075.1 hypothetical protein [Clostridium tertium]MDB1967507.1 hypothetical protein [Clostridium tertium]
MNIRKAISILGEERRTLELIAEVTTEDKRKKELKERVQAYDLILNQIEGKQPIVRIKEFLDSNKNWCRNIFVNDELISNENIEFISKRPSKEVKVVELVIKDNTAAINSNNFFTKREKSILSMKKRIKKFSRELGVCIYG